MIDITLDGLRLTLKHEETLSVSESKTKMPIYDVTCIELRAEKSNLVSQRFAAWKSLQRTSAGTNYWQNRTRPV